MIPAKHHQPIRTEAPPVGWAKRSVPTNPSVTLPEPRIPATRITRPILRQITPPDPGVKRRMRPILHPPHQAVFHRVVMHVIDMPLQINVVANLMLPETPLPDSFLASGNLAGRKPAAVRQPAGKQSFDETPPPAEIRIAFRQSPYRVQMVRQNADRNRLKGPSRPIRLKCGAQSINLLHEQLATPVLQRDREEIRATGDEAASVTGHAETVA